MSEPATTWTPDDRLEWADEIADGLLRRAHATAQARQNVAVPFVVSTTDVAYLVAAYNHLRAALIDAEQRAEESALRSIEARNPGIDIGEVRRQRAAKHGSPEPAEKVVDLMAALEESVAAAKAARRRPERNR